jgi:hypothetical protein
VEVIEDAERVLDCLSGDYVTQETNIRCPVCGFDENHVQRVYTRLGSDDWEAKVYPGTAYQGERTGYRRSAVCIEFWGECEHRWELAIQQNKGVNHLHIRVLR